MEIQNNKIKASHGISKLVFLSMSFYYYQSPAELITSYEIWSYLLRHGVLKYGLSEIVSVANIHISSILINYQQSKSSQQ